MLRVGHGFANTDSHTLHFGIGAESYVERIVITDLKENTFFALIHLARTGETLAIDARPSDAMALALRAGVPIFVEQTVRLDFKQA